MSEPEQQAQTSVPRYTPPPAAPGGFVATWILPNLGGIAALVVLWVGLLTGLDMLAWAIAAGAWLLNRVGHVVTLLLVRGMPQTIAVGAAGLGMMVRIWLIAFALFLVGADFGLGRRDTALLAIALFLVFLTFDIAARGITYLRDSRAADADADANRPGEETFA